MTVRSYMLHDQASIKDQLLQLERRSFRCAQADEPPSSQAVRDQSALGAAVGAEDADALGATPVLNLRSRKAFAMLHNSIKVCKSL